jgi:hypothetical protein
MSELIVVKVINGTIVIVLGMRYMWKRLGLGELV